MSDIKELYSSYQENLESIRISVNTNTETISNFQLDENFVKEQFDSISKNISRSFERSNTNFQSIIKLYTKLAGSLEFISANRDLQLSFDLQKVHLGTLTRFEDHRNRFL